MRLGTHRPARSSSRTTARSALGPTARRTGAAVLAASLLLGAGACSGDEEPTDDPAASASTGDDVVAQDGPEVETDTAVFSAPEGFDVTDSKKGSEALTASGPAGNLVSVVELPFPGEAPSLERQAEIALDGLGEKFTVEDPVTVDGVEMWHLSGKEGTGRFVEVYGAVRDDTAVRLTLRLTNDEYDADQRAAVQQQVLDSWTWAAS